MTATAAAIKRLDDLFQTIRLEEQKKNVRNKMDERVQPNSIVITKECDIHGKRTSHRRGSTEPRAGPISLNSLGTKTAHSRESLRYGWPGHVVSTLRKEQSSAVSAAAAIAAPFVSSTAATRRDVAPNANIAIGAANKQPNDDVATRRDYATNVKPSANCTLRKDGLSLARRFSTDSLDSAIRCNSWERKRESSGSSTETIREEDNINKKQVSNK